MKQLVRNGQTYNIPEVNSESPASIAPYLEAINADIAEAPTFAAQTDVDVSSPAVGDTLRFNGTDWVNVALPIFPLLTLATLPVDSSGYQVVNVGGAIAGGSATGLADTVPATAGYQVVDVGGAKVGGSATGLANDATAYTASIDVDGTPNAVSVVGSAAQTYTDLLTEINADLSGAVASLDAGNIKVTSSSTGATSTIDITDTDLFGTLTDFVAVNAAVDGEAAVDTTYTASISVDGTPIAISIVGSAAQTYTDLLTELNTDLGVNATAAIVGGNLRVTSATTEGTSTVAITDTDLFSSLSDYVAILAAVAGEDVLPPGCVVIVTDANSGAGTIAFYNGDEWIDPTTGIAVA